MTHAERSLTPWPGHFRASIAKAPDIGAGNFFQKLRLVAPSQSTPLIWTQRPTNGLSGGLSIDALGGIVDRVAAFHHAKGIRPRDPVALYVDDGIEPFVHFLALTALGAIPALINCRLEYSTAAAFTQRIGAVALLTDDSRLEAMSQLCGSLSYITTMATALQSSGALLPPSYPYQHVDEDPVLLTHSSGTTGVPKAVLMQHRQFFSAIRYRLSLPLPAGAERVLTALPSVHNSAITLLALALLNGTPIKVMSERNAHAVLSAIAEFRPTMVASFPQTYVAICEEDLSRYDLSSVALWYNSGDAAHEIHVRKLVAQGHHYSARGKGLMRGSRFVDGLGSSEMGHSLFHVTRGMDSTNYSRCIGTPLPFVEAAVLDDEGNKLGAHAVGRLGVRSPTVTAGYWNDSALTWRSRLRGYWLTGDLVYRDSDGVFYHVDRVTDAIQTKQGVLYSCLAEELVLARTTELADCSVVGVQNQEDEIEPLALVRLKVGMHVAAPELLTHLNGIMGACGMPLLGRVIIGDECDLPVGVTGKIKKRALRERLSAGN